jgi:hypothetical protein
LKYKLEYMWLLSTRKARKKEPEIRGQRLATATGLPAYGRDGGQAGKRGGYRMLDAG